MFVSYAYFHFTLRHIRRFSASRGTLFQCVERYSMGNDLHVTDWEKITRLSSKTLAAAKKFIGTMGDGGEPHTQEPEAEPSNKKGKRGRRNLYKKEVSAPFACAPFVVSRPRKSVNFIPSTSRMTIASVFLPVKIMVKRAFRNPCLLKEVRN